MRMRWMISLMSALAFAAVMCAGVSALAGETVTPEQMFQDTCSRCHGPKGYGDGPDGITLSTHPRNFHDCDIMAKDSDDKVFEEIKGGSASIGRSNDMPSWGEALTDDEIRGLLGYVRNFCKK